MTKGTDTKDSANGMIFEINRPWCPEEFNIKSTPRVQIGSVNRAVWIPVAGLAVNGSNDDCLHVLCVGEEANLDRLRLQNPIYPTTKKRATICDPPFSCLKNDGRGLSRGECSGFRTCFGEIGECEKNSEGGIFCSVCICWGVGFCTGMWKSGAFWVLIFMF